MEFSMKNFPRFSLGQIAGWSALAAIAVVGGYIAIGECSGKVNNTELAINPPGGGSYIIESMARGIERELDSSGWTPSRSPFQTDHIRFDVRGFQSGVQQVMIKLVQQANNHFTREGSSSGTAADIKAALNNINRDNVWSVIPNNDTENQYRAAVKHLDNFNKNLAAGTAAIDPRIDTLSLLTNDLSGLIGDDYAQLKKTSDAEGVFSMAAREQFFHSMGVLAATCWTYKGIEADYASVIKLQSTPGVFEQAAKSACATLDVKPTIVLNGKGYGWGGSNLITLMGAESKLLNDMTTLQSSLAAGTSSRPHP